MTTPTVANVMARDVPTARPATPVDELARALDGNRVGALPVLDPQDRVIGMVSRRDLRPGRAQRRPGRRRWWPRPHRRTAGTVRDVMTASAGAVTPGTTLAQAARRMIEHGVEHLPVVDGGALVGVVSRADLVRAFVRPGDDIHDAVLGEAFRYVLWADPAEVDVTVTDAGVTVSGAVAQRSTTTIGERLVHRIDGVVYTVSGIDRTDGCGGTSGRAAPPTAGSP